MNDTETRLVRIGEIIGQINDLDTISETRSYLLNHTANLNKMNHIVRSEVESLKADISSLEKRLDSLQQQIEHITQSYSESMFISCCKTGELDKIKKLHNINTELNIHTNNSRAFELACINNHLNIICWLYDLDPQMYLRTNYHMVFITCCKNGHIDVVKWLYHLAVYKYDHILFSGCVQGCANGHLDISQWLYTIHPRVKTLVETCNFNEFDIVCLICLSGQGKHLEGIIWLYERIMSDVRNQLMLYAFNNAIQNDDMPLAKMLYELDPGVIMIHINKLQRIQPEFAARLSAMILETES